MIVDCLDSGRAARLTPEKWGVSSVLSQPRLDQVLIDVRVELTEIVPVEGYQNVVFSEWHPPPE